MGEPVVENSDTVLQPQRKSRRKFIITSLLIAPVGLWFGRRTILKSVFGFAPSPTGGTRTGTTDQIRFTFDGKLQVNGLPAPWQSRVIFGKLTSSVVDGPSGERALRFASDKAHYVLWYEAVPFEAQKYPILSWSWKAIQLPPQGDCRTHSELPVLGKNRNDKALQVMIGFEGDLVLNYAWDSNAPLGFECDEWSPVAKVKTQIVDSGLDHLNEWREHRINIVDDFARRYGKPPGKVLGVSISANTNHTASFGEGIVGTITSSAK